MTPEVPPAKPFTAPHDAEVYAGAVIERVEGLIEAGVWEGMETVRLRTWLGNFRTDLEKYFAARVLDALVFRSHAQTLAMMRQLLERCLVDLLRLQPANDGLGEWQQGLTQKTKAGDPHMRIVPVIRNNDPPTKSGVIVARYFKRHFGINESWMIWPWQIEKAVSDGVRRFMFVDDFLGTGTQFCRFSELFKISDNLKDAYAVYAPLVAHADGVEKVKTGCAGIKVCPVEVLDKRYGLFDPTSPAFDDGENDYRAANAFYNSLIEERVRPSKLYKNGFGQLQLAYAFNHAVPNNCVPLLWVSNDDWEPLFER